MQRVFTWGGWGGWGGWGASGGVATTGSQAGGAWGGERRKTEENWEKQIDGEVGLTTMAMALEGPGLQHLFQKRNWLRVHLRPQPQTQMGMGISQLEILGVI